MPRPKLEDKILQLGKEVAEWQGIAAQLNEYPMGNTPRRLIAGKRGLLPESYYNTSKAFLDDITSTKYGLAANDIVAYVQPNIDTVLNKYEDQNLLGYVMTQMTPEKNKDGNHNEIVYNHLQFLKTQAAKKNDNAKIQMILEKLNDKDLTKTDALIAQADPFFRETAFRSCEIFYTEEFQKAFIGKNGKLDKNKVSQYVKNTYDVSSEKGQSKMAYDLGMNLYNQFATKKEK